MHPIDNETLISNPTNQHCKRNRTYIINSTASGKTHNELKTMEIGFRIIFINRNFKSVKLQIQCRTRREDGNLKAQSNEDDKICDPS